jgi:phosphoribosylaminoimidazole carboxylase (NCAIR synthetase)
MPFAKHGRRTAYLYEKPFSRNGRKAGHTETQRRKERINLMRMVDRNNRMKNKNLMLEQRIQILRHAQASVGVFLRVLCGFARDRCSP